MTYNTKLGNERIKQNFIAVLKPKRLPGAWANTGLLYYQVFDLGEVVSVTVDGVELTKVAGVPAAGQFTYDIDNNLIYVRLSDDSNPALSFLVFTYEIYLITDGQGQYWHRTPDDANSRYVYFQALIEKSPQIKLNTSDTLFGFLPVQSSVINLINSEAFFTKHCYESSFNKASIRLYHWLGDLEIANLKLVYDGYTENLTYGDDKMSLTTLDRIDVFSAEYRNAEESFYSFSLFPNLDPNFSVKPIRYVYGVVDGFIPVNIDYNSDAPSTTNNRRFACIGEQINLNDVTRNVIAGSTTTRTKLNTSQGIRVGDSVWFDRASGTDEYKLVTAVNYSLNTIDHDALATPMVAGDHCKRSFVGNISVVQNGVVYKPQHGRDYVTSGALPGGSSGFTFTNNFEANIAGMTTISPNDRIFCRIYGRKVDTTISAAPFGANHAQTGNMTSPIVIIYDLMRKLGLAETDIDTAAIQTLETANTEAIGFAIPQTSGDAMPTYKELILGILKTSLLRISVNNDNDWTIVKIAPIISSSRIVDDDQILINTLHYTFEYRDILSDIIVEYAQREVADDQSLQQQSTSKQVIASSKTAKYLHGVNKQDTFQSYHFLDADAQILANRLAYVFGDRTGTIEVQTKNQFFDALINDKIQLKRKKLPGFDFDANTFRTRDTAVIKIEKSLESVTITMDDQKGIQDNSGTW